MRNSRYRVFSCAQTKEDNSSGRKFPISEEGGDCRSQDDRWGGPVGRESDLRTSRPSLARARMSAPHFDPEEDPDEEEMVEKVGIITGGASGLPEPYVLAVETDKCRHWPRIGRGPRTEGMEARYCGHEYHAGRASRC